MLVSGLALLLPPLRCEETKSNSVNSDVGEGRADVDVDAEVEVEAELEGQH